MPPTPEEILQRAFPGARVLDCTALQGGISARAVVARVLLPDLSEQHVVVRRPEYVTHEGTLRVVSNEFELLRHCSAHGIRVPRALFLDHDAAAVVLQYVDGAVLLATRDVSGMARQMAAQLAHIHSIALPHLPSLSLRQNEAEQSVLQQPQALDLELQEPLIRDALRDLWPWPQLNRNALLHGDYWPGNILWQDGQLAAVLDWEEAAVGDPLADLSVARLDLLWAFGQAAMDEFTAAYREQTALDWRTLPCWDLLASLRPMNSLARWASVYPLPPLNRPDVSVQSMRDGHRRFVEQALAHLQHGVATELG